MSAWLCKVSGFLAASILLGCTSASTSNTARTGTEQMLVSNAVDQALNKVDFAPFGGRKVFLEEKYLDCVDKNYLVSSLRHRVLMQGGQIVAKPEEADVVLEARNGAVGTNTANSFIGIPEITIPGMFSTPEVKFLNRVNQTGTAKIGLLAYDAKTQEALGIGGTSLAKSDDNNWYVLGIGPWQGGSVRDEVDRGQPRYQNQPWNPVPQQVAFNAPRSAPAVPPATEDAKEKVRLTAGQKEKPAASGRPSDQSKTATKSPAPKESSQKR